MKLKLLGSAINAATTAGAGAAFDGATLVYCINTDSSAQLVSVANSSNVTQGSFHLGAGASANVKFTPVAHHA